MTDSIQIKHFSKGTNITLALCSMLFLVFSMILILFSARFMDQLYELLVNKVFHRSFDFQKWLPTLQVIFCLPIFAVILFNALIFFKYSDRTKTVLVLSVIATLLVSIVYSTFVATNANVNSDIAAEFILAKECVLERSLLPRGYYYATEIRTLNTQLFSAPIFLFTNSWLLNKTLTVFFCCLTIFFVAWHLFNVLKIGPLWLKLLLSSFFFAPFSFQTHYIATWGNYYIPHVVLSLLFACCFIKVVNREYKHERIAMLLMLAFSFVCGFSTIRYVLNFLIPVSVAAVFIELKKNELSTIDNIKAFWLKNRVVRISLFSFLAAGIGYGVNSTILHHFYRLSEWNSTQFCPLGQTSVLTLVKTILSTFGWREGVSVMTPVGFINLMLLAALFLTIYLLFKTLKDESLSYPRKFFLVFVVISFCLNTFVYYTVDFYSRYYYSVLILIIPVIGIVVHNKKTSISSKYLICVMWAVVFLSSSFISIEQFLHSNPNQKREGYVSFLQENGYKHGYSMFLEADATVFLTNGQISVGNLEKEQVAYEQFKLKDKFEYDKWLTPARFYDDAFEGHVFLLLSMRDYEVNKDHKAVLSGRQVYKDDEYIVFDYDSDKDFREAF